MREGERTGFDIDSFFTWTAVSEGRKDRTAGLLRRERLALLGFLAGLPDKHKSADQPITRSETAWIWNGKAFAQGLNGSGKV